MGFDPDVEVSATALASVLGVTARRVQQLAQDGVITAHVRGRYALSDAVGKYIEFREREKAMTKTEAAKQGAEVTIKTAKAYIASMRAKELKGIMHRSEDVLAMTEDMIYTVRSMMLALPGRLAMDVANISTPAEAAERIRVEVLSIMEELSRYRYDPEKYKKRSMERMKMELNEDEADDDS